MSVFTGGPYGRLAIMLNTLSSLNIENITIIIITLDTCPFAGQATIAYAARVREKAYDCEFGDTFDYRILEHMIQTIENEHLVMNQSFVSTAPSGPGISGAFNFSIFKTPLKAMHPGAKLVVKSLLKAPPSRGLTIMKNNK